MAHTGRNDAIYNGLPEMQWIEKPFISFFTTKIIPLYFLRWLATSLLLPSCFFFQNFRHNLNYCQQDFHDFFS
jgi:hypothetical protein